MTIIDIARLFRFVREAQTIGQNRGLRVEAIQHWTGGQAGESWCCDYATMMLDLYFQGVSPIPRTGSCETVYELAKTNGWLTESPIVGDLVLSINSAGIAHHIGIVTNTNPLTSIAGNTSPNGQSSDGSGVFEHAISATPPEAFAFVHYPPPTL